MRFTTLFTILTISAGVIASSPKCPPNNQINIYYPAYNQGLSDIPWSSTNLAYYFVGVTTSKGLTIPKDQVKLGAFVKEARKQGKKPIFTLGGWTGSRYFSTLVATPAARKAFAKQITDLVVGYKMDGLDIDWEYPNSDAIGCNRKSPQDAANFLELLKLLRVSLGPKRILAAAVASMGMIGPDGNALNDVSQFGKVLDYLTLMTYDTYGSWSETTGPNDPLYNTCGDQEASVDSSVAYWTKAGFPACKLLVGVPSYAYSFTTTSATLAITKRNGKQSLMYQPKLATLPKGDSNDVKAPAGVKDVCGVEQPAGYAGGWTYNSMVSDGVLSSDGKKGLKGFTRYWDSCSQTPFLFNSKTRQFIAYEDSASVAAKAKYAKDKGLAGIIVFDSMGFSKNVYASARAQLKPTKRSLHLK